MKCALLPHTKERHYTWARVLLLLPLLPILLFHLDLNLWAMDLEKEGILGEVVVKLAGKQTLKLKHKWKLDIQPLLLNPSSLLPLPMLQLLLLFEGPLS